MNRMVEQRPVLPPTWRWQPIDSLASVQVSTVDKKSYVGESPAFLCNYTDVYYNDEITSSLDFMEATASPEQVLRFSVRAGDVVITKDSETSDDIGRPSYVPKDLPEVVYGYHLAIYRPFDHRYGKFLRYIFDNTWIRTELRNRTPGVTRVGLNQDTLRHLRIPVPPANEAQRIADYLDCETAEIDAFIVEHERLLRLLEERTTTAIQTRVLGTDLPDSMPTGHSWPATLPTNWTAQRVSWLFQSTGSGTTPSSDDAEAFGGDVPWVTTGELREKPITSTEKMISQETLRRYSALKVHPSWSLLIAMYGATIGRLGWLEVPATVNQAVCVLSGYQAGPLRFAYYALLAARPHLLNLASGGGQPNINQEKIRSLRLPVPPVSEQERIVAELDHELGSYVNLKQDIEASIALAQERRIALVSAAVTGQIDVTDQEKSAAEQLQDELEVRI